MICNRCGAPTVQSTRQWCSEGTRQLVSDQNNRCLCRSNEAELKRAIDELEDKIEGMMHKWFPGETITTVKLMVHDLPTDDPLRVEIVQRMTFMSRLQERLKKVREKASQQKKLKKVEVAEKPGIMDLDERRRMKAVDLLNQPTE